MIANGQKNQIWAGSIFGIIIFLVPYVSLADGHWINTSSFADPVAYQNTGVTTLFIRQTYLASGGYAVGSVGSSSLVSDNNQEGGFTCTIVPSSLGLCDIFMVVPPNDFFKFDSANLTGGISIVRSQEYQQQGQSTTTSYIDNPNQDYFYGIVLFMGTAWFMVWLFRKNR